MNKIDALIINFSATGFIILYLRGKRKGWKRKRNLSIKYGSTINRGRDHNKNISNFSIK